MLKREEITYLFLLKRGLPIPIAAWLVSNDAAITRWLEQRESGLLVGVALLLCALLHPRIQRGLIVTLSYGVAFLALRGAAHVFAYPAPISNTPVALLRGAFLLTAVALAVTGAIYESLEKRSVKGRRFYTGAGAIYFLDHGLIALFWAHSWQSLVLVFSGITCAIGAIFAERLAHSNTIEIDIPRVTIVETVTEKSVLRTEWHDTTEKRVPPPS